MVELAHGAEASGSFDCDVGDIRSVRLGRRFDAVISLFHVMSYQILDSEVAAVLDTAACHLAPGGLLLFDVWHGPAVLFQGPASAARSLSMAVSELFAKPPPLCGRKTMWWK